MVSSERSPQDLSGAIPTSLAHCEGIVKVCHTFLVIFYLVGSSVRKCAKNSQNVQSCCRLIAYEIILCYMKLENLIAIIVFESGLAHADADNIVYIYT